LCARQSPTIAQERPGAAACSTRPAGRALDRPPNRAKPGRRVDRRAVPGTPPRHHSRGSRMAAAAATPLNVRQVFNLPALGIAASNISIRSTTMVSEKAICVNEPKPDGSRGSVAVVDTASGRISSRQPISAEATTLSPDAKIIAVRGEPCPQLDVRLLRAPGKIPRGIYPQAGSMATDHHGVACAERAGPRIVPGAAAPCPDGATAPRLCPPAGEPRCPPLGASGHPWAVPLLYNAPGRTLSKPGGPGAVLREMMPGDVRAGLAPCGDASSGGTAGSPGARPPARTSFARAKSPP